MIWETFIFISQQGEKIIMTTCLFCNVAQLLLNAVVHIVNIMLLEEKISLIVLKRSATLHSLCCAHWTTTMQPREVIHRDFSPSMLLYILWQTQHSFFTNDNRIFKANTLSIYSLLAAAAAVQSTSTAPHVLHKKK